ncbi:MULTISPECIES: hypothetical protein [unclassified Acinetobacter]|uniref:hypothetical protein n=1 Tax=unclassified Acinetobacter TaxID=196816 RepID=UPI0025776C84|nr:MULTISPECIES: hypothetical protein [unclassified Acinetobacter]MDM1763683.1 hypothetical protein [Acinetobacter sp. 226-1]MDM1767162.1 hypothetical protein [Acinetobacter sp. 226-4]
MIKKIILSLLLLQSTAIFAKTVQLDELYQRYSEADYSSLELAEYNTEVDFQAIVSALDENIEGGVLLEVAGLKDSTTALARVVPVDTAAAQFSQLQEGQKVHLKCTVEMASGSEYLSLGECAVK